MKLPEKMDQDLFEGVTSALGPVIREHSIDGLIIIVRRGETSMIASCNLTQEQVERELNVALGNSGDLTIQSTEVLQ